MKLVGLGRTRISPDPCFTWFSAVSAGAPNPSQAHSYSQNVENFMTIIKQEDLIESVAAALQYISY